jgi:thiaminase
MIQLPVWINALPLFTTIFHLPFNQAMRLNTLPKPAFNRFLTQDKIYLAYYGEALRHAALCAPNEEAREQLNRFRKDTLAYEAELYQVYLIPDNQHPHGFFTAPEKPIYVIKAYGQHLLKQPDYAAKIAALAPCFWLYASIGDELDLTSIPKNHPYLAWLETYADPDFRVAAEQLVALLEDCFENAKDDAERAQLTHIFFQSLKYEMAFFEVSYPKQAAKNEVDFSMLKVKTL